MVSVRARLLSVLAIPAILLLVIFHARNSVAPLPLETFELVGRWVKAGPTATAAWGGSSFRIHFTGSRLIWVPGSKTRTSRDAHQRRTVVWTLNGRKIGEAVVQAGKKISLISPNIDGHSPSITAGVVEVVLADWAGVLDLGTLEVDVGATLERPPPRPNHLKFEFIGDSLTCGYQAPSASLDEPLVDSYTAYSTLIGRALDVPTSVVAFPGIQLLDHTPESSGTQFASSGMTSRHALSGPDELSPVWDIQLDAPTHVFINLGTNDLLKRHTSSSDFVLALRGFIDSLITAHAAFGLEAIFIIDPFGVFRSATSVNSNIVRTSIYSDVVQLSVKEAYRGGDKGRPSVEWINTDGWLNSSSLQDGLHPTVEGHQKIARKLEEVLGQRGMVGLY